MTEDFKQTDLEKLLSDNPATEGAEPPEPATEAPKGETQDAEPPAAADDDGAQTDDEEGPPLVPRKAVIDERRKRQELQTKLSEMEAKIKALSEPKQEQRQPAPPPDLYEDPEGYTLHQQRQFQRSIFDAKVEMSREMMIEKHADYDEVEAVFAEAAKHNPQLAQQLVQSSWPAKFAYEMGKKIKFLIEIGEDPEAYRERIRNEVLAEQSGGVQPPANPAAKAPTSLAAVPSAPRARKPNGQYDGPVSLSEILDD